MSSPLKGLLVSDFNTANLAAHLHGDAGTPSVQVSVAPFGQVSSLLLNAADPVWTDTHDFVFVWTRPEAAIPSFQRFSRLLDGNRQTIFEEVDAFAAGVIAATRRTRAMIVATWELPPYHPGQGVMDLAGDYGISRLLLEMNLRLLTALDGTPGAVVLNSHKWFQLAGEASYNARLWYLGKIPYSATVFQHAAADLKSALRTLRGDTRKLVIVDLDDTLWGGVVGDLGWQNIVLGGHDPAGEALIDFQQELKTLSRRGVLLAIASKNDEQIALEAVTKHPEMVLRRDDFAAWRINWRDKVENITDLVLELNLGLSAAVFIDDNPVERARVREALPDVYVPEWPADKRLYPSALLRLDCFSSSTITEEDRARGQLYATERERLSSKQRTHSLDEWLQSLDTRVQVETVNDTNRGRVVQLLNKTNQMNLRTRRLTEAELTAWRQDNSRDIWAFRVADRFGDSGICGIASLSVEGGHATISDFVLSCRVMGRQVEEAMLHVLSAFAREAGADSLSAAFAATDRNAPCLEFLRRSRLTEARQHYFVWPLHDPYPSPAHILLSLPASELSSAET